MNSHLSSALLLLGRRPMLAQSLFAMLVALLAGCRSYTESTPRQTFEVDHVANYERVFKEKLPANVTVLNSVVVGYARRPGVVTTDDFEFELLAPASDVERWKKLFYLGSGTDLGVEMRKNRPLRPWYAPKPYAEYVAYRDVTSAGYVHLLIDKQPESGGRLRVFISKH